MSLSRKELWDFAYERLAPEGDVLEADYTIVAYYLDHCEITVPEENQFSVCVNCAGLQNTLFWERSKVYTKALEKEALSLGAANFSYTGEYDFGHTSADWDSVISLGIWGLKERIGAYRKASFKDEKKARFYALLDKVYEAALRFMHRAARKAREAGKPKMAEGLENLCVRRPKTLFEALQTSLIYYTMQQMIEGTNLRTLGRLDSLLFPFWEKEDKQAADWMLKEYIKEIDRLMADANIPFALGGTDVAGESLVNELSYALLSAYQEVDVSNTKLHLLCAESTPKEFICQALSGVCRGKNSIVFMNDAIIRRSLEALGEEAADASEYHVVGCYECGGRGELTCSCNARVNIPKAVELALFGGRDMQTGSAIGLSCPSEFSCFDEFLSEVKRQMVRLCRSAMAMTDFYEVHYKTMHASPLLSGTYPSALEKGGDLYVHYAAKYNNSSLNALGLATAVDSLLAIKKLVFDDGTLQLSRLTEILLDDWQGEEALRLRVKHKYPKFGTGNAAADALAKELVDCLAEAVNGQTNKKGGKWRLGLFSINWRWAFGEKTAASADGRHRGEPLSQNTSASFGADREGATAHLLSVAAIDASKTPNATIVDIDLHASSVAGENGQNALYTTLITYFELGGFAVHYNVLDTEVLKKARQHPEDFPNLQVRLCGWNVLFSSLTDKEKDEFIARSVR